MKTKLSDNLFYMTEKNFTFVLSDDKVRQFGIVFDILDMAELTGDAQFQQYPFVVSAYIVAHDPHKSFAETESRKKRELIYDTYMYMGGVPIDDYLANSVKRGDENEAKEPFDILAEKFDALEATVKIEKYSHGTIAARQGIGNEHKYLQFKTEDAAIKYVKLLVKRLGVVPTMISFILDKPINLVGEDGWSVLETMTYGSRYNR